MRRPLKIGGVIGGVLILIVAVLFVWSGGKLISLEYVDFPQSELEKLIVPEVPKDTEPGFSGPLEVEASSKWTWLAMKLFPGTFLVDVRVNGRKASLVVDTGASWTVLSPRLAVAAQLHLTSPGPIAHHGEKKLPSYVGRIREFELGGMIAHNISAFVMGKQPVLKLLGLPIWHLDGLLGMKDLLEQLVLTLDYQRRVVTLRRESLPVQARSAPLRVLRERTPEGLEDLRPIVECYIDGSKPYPCFIDTGTSAPVLIPSDIWQELGLGNRKEYRFQRLQLGEIELQNAPAQVSNTRFILIGSNIFKAQGFKRLTLDFLAGKLYLER